MLICVKSESVWSSLETWVFRLFYIHFCFGLAVRQHNSFGAFSRRSTGRKEIFMNIVGKFDFPPIGPDCRSPSRLAAQGRKRNFRRSVCQPLSSASRPCSVHLKPIPLAGGETNTGGACAAADFHRPCSPFRRNKLRILRFRASAKAASLRCSSSPNRTRCVGLRFGAGPYDRTAGSHTAFVLNRS